jgi:hypothetical protein
MSDKKVLLDFDIAEQIFSSLSAVNITLKESGMTPLQRMPLMRQMVKLKVAIIEARDRRDSETVQPLR